MEEVQAREYWHITREKGFQTTPLLPGRTLEVGGQYNPFFAHCYLKNMVTEPDSQHFLAAMLKNRRDMVARPARLYDLAVSGLRESTIQLREVTMEYIRSTAFPDHPPRVTGLWLIDRPECVEFWLTKLKFNSRPGMRLVKLKAWGKAHLASNRWVKNDTISLKAYFSNAQNYWAGVGVGTPRDEVIFTGRVEVLHQVDPKTLEPLPD